MSEYRVPYPGEAFVFGSATLMRAIELSITDREPVTEWIGVYSGGGGYWTTGKNDEPKQEFTHGGPRHVLTEPDELEMFADHIAALRKAAGL